MTANVSSNRAPRLLAPRLSIQVASLVVATLTIVAPPGLADTWFVHADGSGDHPDIPAAMAAATAGDTVLVSAGVYTTLVEDGASEWAAVIMKSGVVLRSSEGAEATVLDVADDQRFTRGVVCVDCEDGTVVEGFTVIGGDVFDGAAFVVEGGAPTIRGNWMLDAYGGQGGSMVVREGARPRIQGNLFLRSRACCGLGGAIHVEDASPVIVNNEFESCESAWDGGAVSLVDAGGEILGNHFLDNLATHGGAIYASGSQTAIVGNVFSGNRASSHGGAVAMESETTSFFGENVVESNVANGFGGGLYVDRSSPIITRVTIRDNEAVSQGGGIYVDGPSSPLVSGCIVAFNRGWDGVVVAHPLAESTFECSDIFGNAGDQFWGFVDDPIGSDGNVSVDPLFCQGTSALRHCSRFARRTECGRVGAALEHCACGFGSVRM